jgi:excisionase family DNA binding protein
MNDVITILARIEEQNLDIISRLSPKANRRYLSVEEVAERLNRSAWTIRQLCNCDQIRAVKGDDGCWRIPADDVTRLEECGVPRLQRR